MRLLGCRTPCTLQLKMACKPFSFLSLSRFLLRRLTNTLSLHRRSIHAKLQKYPSAEKLANRTLVCDVEGGLLRSSTIFPYFMLVALEAGGFLRGLLLLLLYPLLCFLSQESGLRAMVMVSFCGVKEETFRAGRAVLPKSFLEDVGLEGFEVLRKSGRRVCVSRLPRVMVEGFLKEYLEVEVVLGSELKVLGGYFTGLMAEESKVGEALEDSLGGEKKLGEEVIGFGSYSRSLLDFFSHFKEVYLVSEAEKRKWHPLPRKQYPRPLVFHDGRIALRPTPADTLAMFIWLPLGFILAIFRALVFVLLPFCISIPIGALAGMESRLITSTSTTREEETRQDTNRIYVCNHRTLLDPIYISAALNKPLTAVTYSLSRISELLSPIRTVRLTRNKDEDRRIMKGLLSQGGIVVCPEGTTCREPYLLRFSPLFAELTDEIIPVALVAKVGMFYGTTASGLKCFDPLYFLMNPRPKYDVEFLHKISTRQAGKNYRSYTVANHVQSELGRALGFECTGFTRKDKYLMLAGNEGFVETKSKGSMRWASLQRTLHCNNRSQPPVQTHCDHNCPMQPTCTAHSSCKTAKITAHLYG